MPDVVRFNLYLPRAAFEVLKRCRTASGKTSLAATVRAAVALYAAIQGKDVILRDKATDKEERVVFV